MAFKRAGSSVYQIRRRSLAGYGDTGQLSSGVRDKRVAERMERALEELAERALVEPRYKALLDAICRAPHSVSLPALMQARAERRIDALLVTLSDPLLAPICEAMAVGRDKPTRVGLVGLPALIAGPHGDAGAVRLSALLDRARVVDALRRAEASGLQRNSVRRQYLRAISIVLRERAGEAERQRVLSGIDFAATDDTREVALTPGEIARLLDVARGVHDELDTLVMAALLLSADRGVLLAGASASGSARGLRVRDIAIYQIAAPGGPLVYEAEVSLRHDAKAAARRRIVVAPDDLARRLLSLTQGRADDEPVFSIAYAQLDYLWQRARDQAGLPHVRFKDLRAQFAIYADRAGIPTVVASRAMGHQHERMTARYQRHAAAMTGEHAGSLAAAMLGQSRAA